MKEAQNYLREDLVVPDPLNGGLGHDDDCSRGVRWSGNAGRFAVGGGRATGNGGLWAATPARSYVPRAERLRDGIESAGFTLKAWRNTLKQSDWCGKLVGARRSGNPPAAGSRCSGRTGCRPSAISPPVSTRAGSEW